MVTEKSLKESSFAKSGSAHWLPIGCWSTVDQSQSGVPKLFGPRPSNFDPILHQILSEQSLGVGVKKTLTLKTLKETGETKRYIRDIENGIFDSVINSWVYSSFLLLLYL